MIEILSRTFQRFSVFLLMGAVLLVSSCAEPRSPFLQERFPIKAEKKTFTMAVKFTDGGNTIDSRSKSRIQGFVREFHRVAKTPVLVSSVSGESDPSVISRLNTVRDSLVSEGVSSTDIIVKPGQSTIGTEDVVVVSFRGYKIKVPECGDWSGESAFSPSNRPHSNFGCAYQRNIGLMISNPGDLLGPEALAPDDPNRLGNILESFKTKGVETKGEEGTVK
ncbi:MAG: CpaD family pilus assembly protein [Rhodospirillales bacterium]|nr:CpaD family pilus assembly protein [Rhodospirillales bacterium]